MHRAPLLPEAQLQYGQYMPTAALPAQLYQQLLERTNTMLHALQPTPIALWQAANDNSLATTEVA
jgi:hypothetical protein